MEVKQVIHHARTASAPGPNGVPYKVFKNCPRLLKLLWRLMVTAWKTQSIPSSWCQAVTTFIPKEKKSQNLCQFRGIALLNVEGKIFFSILARHLTNFLLVNSYIDTSCQKAGVPGFPGCVEHSAMIWEQIQNAKHSKSDLHVVWLDLANAFGSVPHQLITFALEFFHVPSSIQKLIANYFNNLYVCYTTWDITTAWHHLEKGIAMGCSSSPILFTTAFKIILIGGKQMVGGVKSQTVRSYMDDDTTLLQTAACTARLLKSLEELLGWACMKIKPTKSRSLSIQKGIRIDNICFTVDGERIPLVVEEPVRSLGRLYMADLSDKHMVSAIATQLTDGLHKINQCFLPGKFKVWCYQFTLYQRLMWPLKLCDITLTSVLKLEAKANTYVRKWLGLKVHIISEVTKMDEEQYKITAISQQKQGKWSTWEAVTNWHGAEEPCHLCSSPTPGLKHILSSCKAALAQGRYRWRHDKVLRKLAEVLEMRRLEVNRASVPSSQAWIQFVRQGAQCSTSTCSTLLSPGGEWQLRANPSSPLRPDMLWSVPARVVILVELTVPWEEEMEAAYERKKERYADLVAACSQAGWRAFTFLVEVGCRGFIGTSTQQLLKTLGFTGQVRKQAMQHPAQEAEQGSFWLWLRRKDKAWGRDGS